MKSHLSLTVRTFSVICKECFNLKVNQMRERSSQKNAFAPFVTLLFLHSLLQIDSFEQIFHFWSWARSGWDKSGSWDTCMLLIISSNFVGLLLGTVSFSNLNRFRFLHSNSCRYRFKSYRFLELPEGNWNWVPQNWKRSCYERDEQNGKELQRKDVGSGQPSEPTQAFHQGDEVTRNVAWRFSEEIESGKKEIVEMRDRYEEKSRVVQKCHSQLSKNESWRNFTRDWSKNMKEWKPRPLLRDCWTRVPTKRFILPLTLFPFNVANFLRGELWSLRCLINNDFLLTPIRDSPSQRRNPKIVLEPLRSRQVLPVSKNINRDLWQALELSNRICFARILCKPNQTFRLSFLSNVRKRLRFLVRKDCCCS